MAGKMKKIVIPIDIKKLIWNVMKDWAFTVEEFGENNA